MRRLVTAALQTARRAGNRVWEPWCQFWFQPADPTPLAVMRILFGGMLLYTHFVWGLKLDGFFGPNGWQGETLVRTVQQGQLTWSFWWWVSDNWRLTVHLVSLGILALYMLGVVTPVTSILAYVITVSYAYRAPLANYGLDQINAIAVLYLAIGPSGAVLSVDRLWQRYRAARRSKSAGEPLVVPPVKRSARANLALRLMQVHLCVIYLFACHSKLQGESWWNGQAIWQAVSNLEYQSMDLTWLAWYPWLVNLLTHATIVWEMTFWALVWRPLCRPFVLLTGVGIHLGIGAFMGMWTFGLAVIFMYVAFLPATTIHAFWGVLVRPFRKTAQTRRLEATVEAGRPPETTSDALDFEQRPDEPEVVAGASSVTEPPDLVPQVTAGDSPSADAIPQPAEAPNQASEPAAATARRPLPGARPVLVLVESRLKRQTQIQEYLVKRGFRCFVASELHQARSLLSVVDVDALVVTSTWFPDEEVRSFRDALISGGPALPASLFFLTTTKDGVDAQLKEYDRHRLVRAAVSLRELRLLVLDVLGDCEPGDHSNAPHAAHSSNGNGHKPPLPARPSAAAGQSTQPPYRLTVDPIENGAQT